MGGLLCPKVEASELDYSHGKRVLATLVDGNAYGALLDLALVLLVDPLAHNTTVVTVYFCFCHQ